MLWNSGLQTIIDLSDFTNTADNSPGSNQSSPSSAVNPTVNRPNELVKAAALPRTIRNGNTLTVTATDQYLRFLGLGGSMCEPTKAQLNDYASSQCLTFNHSCRGPKNLQFSDYSSFDKYGLVIVEGHGVTSPSDPALYIRTGIPIGDLTDQQIQKRQTDQHLMTVEGADEWAIGAEWFKTTYLGRKLPGTVIVLRNCLLGLNPNLASSLERLGASLILAADHTIGTFSGSRSTKAFLRAFYPSVSPLPSSYPTAREAYNGVAKASDFKAFGAGDLQAPQSVVESIERLPVGNSLIDTLPPNTFPRGGGTYGAQYRVKVKGFGLERVKKLDGDNRPEFSGMTEQFNSYTLPSGATADELTAVVSTTKVPESRKDLARISNLGIIFNGDNTDKSCQLTNSLNTVSDDVKLDIEVGPDPTVDSLEQTSGSKIAKRGQMFQADFIASGSFAGNLDKEYLASSTGTFTFGPVTNSGFSLISLFTYSALIPVDFPYGTLDIVFGLVSGAGSSGVSFPPATAETYKSVSIPIQ